MDWVDSPDYLEELAQFLAPTQNTVFSEGLWWAYTDVTRFQGFLDLLRRHTAVEGKRILDSGCGAAGMLIALQMSLNSGWAVRALQFVQLQTRSYVSVLGSISLNVVCRKAAPGQVHL